MLGLSTLTYNYPTLLLNGNVGSEMLVPVIRLPTSCPIQVPMGCLPRTIHYINHAAALMTPVIGLSQYYVPLLPGMSLVWAPRIEM